MSKGFKHLLLSCAVIALLFATGSSILHSLWFQSYLLSQLGRALHWNLSIRDSELKLLRGRIFLDGVHAENRSKTMSVSAEKVRFDLSVFSIIRGKIIVTDFAVVHPVVFIQKTEQQKGVLPADILQRVFGRYERSLLLQSIFLEDATITDLLLTVTDPETGEIRTGNVDKVAFGASTTLLNELRAEATITGTSGLFPTTDKITFKTSLGRRGLSINMFHLEAPKVTLDIEGKVLGDLMRGSVQVSGAVEVPTVLSEKVTFAVDAALKEKMAEVKSIKAALGKATFDASGKIVFLDLADMKKIKYDLPFEARDLPLESIFGKMPSAILGPAKGLGSVKGRAQGELPDLKARADATIRDFRHGAMRARQVDGTLDFHWPDLDFDADIKPGETGHIEGHARGGVIFKYLPPFKSIKAALKTVDVTFDGGTLKDILPTANVAGNLKGELHLRGVPGSTSAEGPGHAEVTNGRWFLGPVDRFVSDMMFKPGGLIIFTKTEFHAPAIEPILWPDPLTLDTEEGLARYSGHPAAGLFVEGSYETKTDVFKIDKLEYRKDGSDLTGSLTLRDSGTEAKLKGKVNLESLSAVPSLFREMRGFTQLDLSMTGTTKDPEIRGWIDFQKDDVGIRGIPSIEELEGRLALDGPTVRPSLSGLLGDGRFQLGGSLKLKRFQPESFDLTLKGDNLSYTRPNAYRFDLDADLKLTGSLPSPRLSGRIDIVDALYTKPFRLRELVLKPFEDEITEEATWQKTLEPWQLDLVVKHSGDLRIKNNIASIYLLADLQVGGTYGRPLISGALTATEGEVHLFSDTFTLTEGRLEYIDPSRKEPYLTIVAEEDMPPLYTVTVEIKGYLSNLEVNLSSIPALPREDVLSLITTGHTQEELRQSGITRQSMGLGVLAGEITSAIEQPIAKSTGLDVFRLEASESGQLSKVALGKNLTDRLTVEFQSDFAPETAQRTLQANYYLTDNILLKGTRVWESGQSGTQPRYNFNVSFRLRMY
ncbi:MAG TPA: translocation/assembly module TamB domain-containing protein [bacterium]|nr:translocation/assembly module TamB domain-containing protein [bacterium]